MAKLGVCLLILSVLVLTSTASKESSSGSSASRSASGLHRGRTFPGEIPRSVLRARQAALQRRTRPIAKLTAKDHKSETVEENKASITSGKVPEDIASNLNARNEKEITGNSSSHEDERIQHSSEKELNAISPKTVIENLPRNGNESLPVRAKILNEADMVHDLQRGGIQLGKGSPRTKSKSTPDIKQNKNYSLHPEGSSGNQVSNNDIKEVSLNSTESISSSENRSYDLISEESLESKLEVTSEEYIDSVEPANELTEEVQNSRSIEGNSADDSNEKNMRKNLNSLENNQNSTKTKAGNDEKVDLASVSPLSISKEPAKPNKSIPPISDVEILKNISSNKERSQKLKSHHHESSHESARITETNQDAKKSPENLKIRAEKGGKLAETTEAENLPMVVKQNDLRTAPTHEDEKKNVEPARKEIQVKEFQVGKTSNVVNISKSTSQSTETSNLSDDALSQKTDNNAQGSNFDASARNPLAIFPKDQPDIKKAEPAEERPTIAKEDAHSRATNTSTSNRNHLVSSQSVHPKLERNGNSHAHEQPSKSSVVPSNVGSERLDSQKARGTAVHPKLDRKPGGGRNEAALEQTHAAIFHPKLKSKAINSAARETTNRSSSQRRSEYVRNREIAHPKLVDSSRKSKKAGAQINAGSIDSDPMSQHGNDDVEGGETVHPKLVSSSKQSQNRTGDVDASTRGNKSQNSKKINSNVEIERLNQDISKKIKNFTDTISKKASNATETVEKQTGIKIENVSKEVKNRSTQEKVSAQTRRAKSEQLSNMVASIAIAIIVLVTIATIVGAIFKKLSFSRQRYGEHLPLSTEDYDDDDVPLYSRYRPPYESWKEML